MRDPTPEVYTRADLNSGTLPNQGCACSSCPEGIWAIPGN